MGSPESQEASGGSGIYDSQPKSNDGADSTDIAAEISTDAMLDKGSGDYLERESNAGDNESSSAERAGTVNGGEGLGSDTGGRVAREIGLEVLEGAAAGVVGTERTEGAEEKEVRPWKCWHLATV